jgi:hypothetical protein
LSLRQRTTQARRGSFRKLTNQDPDRTADSGLFSTLPAPLRFPLNQ